LNFGRLDGELGMDVLVLPPGDLDLTSITGYQVDGIEVIDNSGGVNALSLDQQTAVNFVGANGILQILADTGDVVSITTDYFGWNTTQTPDATGVDGFGQFTVYLNGVDSSSVTLQVSEFAITQVVAPYGDLVYGSSGAETLTGSAGHDLIISHEGADTILAGDGDDAVYYDAEDVSVDGGLGVDTLKFMFSGESLDLSAVTQLSSFERIDLTGNGDNSLNLNMDDIFDGSTGLVGELVPFTPTSTEVSSYQLLIDGDAGDTVNLESISLNNLAGDQTASLQSAGFIIGAEVEVDGHWYIPLTKGASTLLLDTDIYDPGGI